MFITIIISIIIIIIKIMHNRSSVRAVSGWQGVM